MPTVDINGTQVEYDPIAAESWDVAELLVTVEDSVPLSQYEKLANMFKVVELCTGVDKARFIELCGGGRTSRDEMAQHLGRTIAQLVSKN